MHTGVKAVGGHFEYARWLANWLLRCSNDGVFFAAQICCAFRSAHILLRVNVSNEYVVTEKIQ